MNTPRDQLLMGCFLAGVCLLGLVKSRWFFVETKKGRRLEKWFGERAGLAVLRGLFALGILLGVALALDWIRPLFSEP